jgi:hypothetical protein
VKLKRKINSTKDLKNQKNEDQIQKIIWQIEMEGWNWKQIEFLQKSQETKLEIKRIRIEVEISTIKMVKL